MTYLGAILLGIVHGFTEIFPFSSSGHLAAASNLFGISLSAGGHVFFDFLLHTGTLAAVCVVYWQDVVQMVYEGLGVFNFGPYTGQRRQRYPAARQLFMLLIATLPLIFIAFIRKYLQILFDNTYFVGAAMFLTGLILMCGDRMTPGNKTGGNISALDALIIGICQAVAAIPGISRTAVALVASYGVGMKKEYAVRFSFLLYIPAALGYIILDLIDAAKSGIDWHYLPMYLVGTAAAIVAGVGSLLLFRKLFEKGKTGGFVYYCMVVGVLLIMLTLIF